jgi:hypothetical protein
MALHGNYNVFLKSPGRFLSGLTLAQARPNFGRGGAVKNMWCSEARVDQNNGVPSGYRAPYAWVLAQKGNALASRNEIDSSVNVSVANLAGGLNGDASLDASLNFIQANLALVTSAVCTIATSMAFASDPIIQGKLDAAASLSASGGVTQAMLGAIIDAVAAISSSVSSSADLRAKGSMGANIQPYTDLSPESLALAVMGSTVESGMTLQQAINILTSVAAGKTTITDLGSGTATVVFRDTNDSKDRVTASMTGSSRSSVTINKS